MLRIHRSERADMLVGALTEVLTEPLSDPMAREVVVVPTQGVERWLTQRLSHRLGAGAVGDGICANIDWPFPGPLVEMATAAAWGVAVGPEWRAAAESDPWSPGRLVWPLMQVVDESLDEEFLRPLAGHLRASCGAEPGEVPRRFAAVRHLADLYDHYAVHRPELLLAWLGEVPSGPPSLAPAAGAGGGAGGGGGSWQADSHWQAELWRRLRRRVASPSLAERLAAAPGLLADRPDVLPLPERICVFGLTRLPASHLRVLDAIAAHRDVHLFLLHPSGSLWEKVERELTVRPPLPTGGALRSGDPTISLPLNPLLRSWGRDAREMQVVLASQGKSGGEHLPLQEEATPPSLLGLVQRDVRADRKPPGRPAKGEKDRRPVLAQDDRSLQVHSCHGRARQVEVVREAVLHLLAEDPALEPRDVIVMCPDIELFAPLVSAVFGAAGGPRGPQLRTRLADRSLRQTNPLLAVASHLLDLAGSRVSAPQVLDFASREPVCRRFGLGEGDLSRVEGWVASTGTRWGFDDAHREAWHLGRLGDLATWQRGLDRLLLGVAMGGTDETFGGVLPLDDVTSTDIPLAGRFAELVSRLRGVLELLGTRQPVSAWAAALAEGTERLACAGQGDEWQHDQLRRVLAEAAEAASGTASGPLLDIAEARSLLADRLRGRPTRANFRTGDMTICTLVPMRSVPHRVVCLLGLDDGLFPRHSDQDGDNLLLEAPHVGDRDAPSEDRQILLDALLAAKDHLVVTYSGRDQRLNRRIPPSVPVAELLDVVDETARHPDPTRAARDLVLVEHPLQAFDPRNYTSGELCVDSPWRFDRLNLEGARSLAGDRRPPRPFLVSPLAPLRRGTLQLRSLVQFVEFPVRAFLRERIGFFAVAETEQLSDGLPLDLDPLEGWALGDRLLSSLLTGTDVAEAVEAERGRGLLPLGELGEAALQQSLDEVGALVATARGFPEFAEPAVPVEVNFELPDGRTLVGTVPGVRGRTITRCTFSKVRPKQRLQAWAHLLAASAAHPELAPSALTVGRSEGSAPGDPRTCTQWLGPLGPDERGVAAAATAMLSVLVDLYDRGMREPLPLFCATSAAWARARREDRNPEKEARDAWVSYDRRWGEALEPEHVLVFGEAVDFDRLLEQRPRSDESGANWPEREGHRFGRLAMRLWGPLLDHERLVQH